MNQGKYVFDQITGFLPRRVFDHIVNAHRGNGYAKNFTFLEPDSNSHKRTYI
ncbi:MAG TPA: DUF4372 domain-containing protein [Pricia sp.]|nr:DUF4372 domain-containing protein [Pricia sp.]